MKIVFQTEIDKFKGKFPDDFAVIPRIGEFVKVVNAYQLPFDKLQVVDVTYYHHNLVVVELHLSELQHKQIIEYKLNVFN